MRLIFLLLLFTLFPFCKQAEKKENNYRVNKEINLDGYWILTNYLDKILETKKILKETINEITVESIVLKIQDDSISYWGIIDFHKTVYSKKIDSISTLRVSRYLLHYNEPDSTIIATKKEDTTTYVYRKIRQNEMRLVNNIHERMYDPPLEENFNDFFIDSIFAGVYRPIPNTSNKVLKLYSDGKTVGFKKFDTYRIDNSFGTMHPFESDVMFFEDSHKNYDVPPYRFVQPYKWEFIDDTLVLTEYIITRPDWDYPYELGNKKYRFVKEKKAQVGNNSL